jgi:hypothetical protein
VGQHAVHLLTAPVDPTEFLPESSALGSESFHRLSVGWAVKIELGVVPPEAMPSPPSSSESVRLSLWSHDDVCLFPAAFSAFLVRLSDLAISVAIAWAISSSV